MPVGNVYVNDDVFVGVTDAETGAAVLGALRQILRDLSAVGRRAIFNSLYSLPTGIGGRQFGDLFFSEPERAGLDQSDVRDLTRLLDQCDDGGELGIDEALKLVWFEDNSPANSNACLRIAQEPAGDELPAIVIFSRPRTREVVELGTPDGNVHKRVFHLCDAGQILAYARAVISYSKRPDEVFRNLSKQAFPSISFAADLKPTSLGVDLDVHMESVVRHLAFLDEEYCALGATVNWDTPRLTREAAARMVDLSDESANTKANARAMRQRSASVFVDGTNKTVVCSMHTKLEATRGRIHFCVERTANGHRMIVGLFARHLDT